MHCHLFYYVHTKAIAIQRNPPGLGFGLHTCSELYCIRWTVETLTAIKFLFVHAHDSSAHMNTNAILCTYIIDAIIVKSTVHECIWTLFLLEYNALYAYIIVDAIIINLLCMNEYGLCLHLNTMQLYAYFR